jgi:16S rRNA G966 N2-methylase RsmD
MESIEHINHPLVSKAHTPMYLMHKWWARKPHNVVAEYIKRYSKDGDIVLDPFVGSGVTAIEALKLNRKAVAVDLDPMAIFITRLTARPYDALEIKRTFNTIQKRIKNKIEDLYTTSCPHCDQEALIACCHWRKDKLVKIMFECPQCNKRGSKKPTKFDLNKYNSILKEKIRYWYPKYEFPRGITFNQARKAGDTIADLFTKRNLLALSLLFNQIYKVETERIKDIFLFAFSSLLHLASSLTPVRPTRQYSSFWAMNSYWVPPLHMESNVWNLFDNAVNGKQGILRGKEDSAKNIKFYKEAKKFAQLQKEKNILLLTQSALELDEVVPANSIDYCFTDPPYGGAIQYFELSTLWTSWLKGPKDKGFELNFADEITINKWQKKNFEYYHKMLCAAFGRTYEVLKPGRYLTVTFHSTDIKIFNSIILAVVMAGFDLEKIIYQPPARASNLALLRPYGSAVGDYYIRFRKPERTTTNNYSKEFGVEQYEKIVVSTAKRIIAERGEPTAYTYILNGIYPALNQQGVLLAGQRKFEQILKERLDKDFVLIPVKDEKDKVKGYEWWLKDPASVPHLEKIPLREKVEKAVINVLNRQIKVSYDEVLQEIFVSFPNALTPHTQNVKEVLNEYAEKTADGKWRLRQSVILRAKEHSKFIYYIALLGRKLGYKIWIGLKEQTEYFDDQKLKTLCDEKDLVISDIEPERLERVKNIDCLWYKEDKIFWEFEVENTTGITESIVRGANISTLEVKRVIVIPDEREGLLYRRLQEPILKEQIEKYNWKFIYYRTLEQTFEENKKKKDIDISVIERIFRIPRSNPRGYEQTELFS